MMNKLLKILGAGVRQLQLNVHFLLVAVLVFVIPGLVIFTGSNFFETAYESNTYTQRKAITRLHDSFSILLQNNQFEVTQTYLSDLVESDPQVTKGKIVVEDEDKLIIIASSDLNELNTEELEKDPFAATSVSPEDTFFLDVSVAGNRTWQVVRQTYTGANVYYVFTEHTFAQSDAALQSRQQQVYMTLPFIFLFLIGLAYWLLRQTHWRKRHEEVKNKLKEQMLFTDTIAHELRAPLTAIRGYLSFFFESNNLSSEERKYAENINLSSERMLALINDFLEVARIQSGNLKLEFVDFDIRETLRAVETEFKSVAAEKNLKLKLALPDNPVMAHTDTKRLQQVLTNLVSNALKYTKEGSVTLALEQTRIKTIIRIKDTGLGIAAEDQHKLFGAFTRVGKADKSGVTGTGLGMWITKQLVDLLHGEINVESIEGVGTHVKLTFDV